MSNFARELRKAREEMAQGHIDRAAQRYENILYQDPKNVEALLGITKIAIETKSFKEARRFIEKIREVEPDNIEATFLEAKLLKEEGKPELSYQKLVEVLESDPTNTEALYETALYLYEREYFREAQELLLKAVKVKPDFYEAQILLGRASMKLGDYPVAIDSFRNALKLRSDLLEPYLALSDSLTAVGELAVADSILDEAIGSFGMHPEITSRKSGIKWVRGQYQEAAKFAQKVCDKLPNNPRAWLNLGQINLMAKDLEGAERALLRAAKLDPNNWEVFFNLGMLYEAVGLDDKAKESYRKAIELAPNEWDSYNNLGLLLLASENQSDIEEARRLFQKAVELTGEREPAPLLNLILAMMKLGRLREALPLYQKLKSMPIDDEEIAKQVKQLEVEFK